MARRRRLNSPACRVCGTAPSFKPARSGLWSCDWCTVVTDDPAQYRSGPRIPLCVTKRPGCVHSCRVCGCETWTELQPKDEDGSAIYACDGCGIRFADAQQFMGSPSIGPAQAQSTPAPNEQLSTPLIVCPYCRQPPPAWRLTRDPLLHACKGCGILFKDQAAFYGLPVFTQQKPTGCRKCGGLETDVVTRPGLPHGANVLRCRGCRTVFLGSQMWMRDASDRDRRRFDREQRG